MYDCIAVETHSCFSSLPMSSYNKQLLIKKFSVQIKIDIYSNKVISFVENWEKQHMYQKGIEVKIGVGGKAACVHIATTTLPCKCDFGQNV